MVEKITEALFKGKWIKQSLSYDSKRFIFTICRPLFG